MFRRHHRSPRMLTVIVLVSALVALWWGFRFANEHRSSNDDALSRQTVDERGEALPPANSAPAESPIAEKPSALRAAIMAKASAEARTLLPEAGTIARFWFASDRDCYIEYRRTGEQIVDRMAFVVASGDPAHLALAREALFGQSEAGGWELIEGNGDVLFAKPQRDLYEYDAKVQGWVKRN